jgi:maltose alpha-D-glucosyltransferase/alpha-amylase
MTQSRTLEAEPAVEPGPTPAKTDAHVQPQRAVSTHADVEPWYKTAVIYELHVRAFHDTNGDGVGDFKGLTSRLDYLQDLGVTAIWLLPFYPSPLRDDGYDIADYTGVNESYGSMRDVRRFIREAHKRGLRVITELVLNHTSDQHRWFQRARQSPPGSVYRDTRACASFSRTTKRATGRGTRSPRRITGIAFIRISRI